MHAPFSREVGEECQDFAVGKGQSTVQVVHFRWPEQHNLQDTHANFSKLNMAESVQRIIVPRALAGQHPKNAQEVIDWLEQTVVGWNKNPTPFVWNGKRRRRRERARVRRLAGSGAALVKGYSIDN